MLEWYRRIRDMSDHPGLESGYVPVDELDASFERLGASELTRLAERYGFSYVARSTPLAARGDPTSRWMQVYPPARPGGDYEPRVYALMPEPTIDP